MARICFFARVKDPSVFERVEFYAQDLRILRDLGHEVIVASRGRSLVAADAYFCWWWTWAFVPLAFATVLRRPVIITGVFDEWMFDQRPLVQRLLLRLALRASKANVFVSRLELRTVPSRFHTVAPSYAPCIVESAVYRPGANHRSRTVLTVAWLHSENAERKGIPNILRAAAIVRRRAPDIRFILVGEKGSGYPALQRLASELGLSSTLEFRGIVSLEEKVALMQDCGVYLQPSKFEGFGLAVLEAMACGAPVIASRAGALPEVVGDSGVLLDDPTPEVIAAAVCDLFENVDAATDLSRRAQARAKSQFSYDRRREALRSVIDQTLDGGL